MLFSAGMKGASMYRIVDQSTPSKKGCDLISCAPFLPRRLSGAVMNLQGSRVVSLGKLKGETEQYAHPLIISSASGLR